MAASSSKTLAGVRTLVVEDEPLVASGLRSLLVRAGAEVTIAFTAEAARWRLAGEGPWDLVLLDQTLPDGDGLELLELIEERSPRPAVVAVSAHLQDPKRSRRLQGYPAVLLPKPFDRDDLLLAIADARALAGRETRHSDRPGRLSSESGEYWAVLSFGPIAVDLVTQTVFVGDERMDLQPAQFRILAQMLASQGRSLPVDELVGGALRGTHSDGGANIRFQIHALRRRLGTAGALIERSLHGYGMGLRGAPGSSLRDAASAPDSSRNS